RADAPSPFSFRFRWPAGTEYRYHLHWSAEQRSRAPLPGAPEAAGRSDFECDLVLRSVAAAKDATQLAVSFARFQRAEGHLPRHPVSMPAASMEQSFGGQQAIAEITPAGEVRTLKFQPGTPSPFRRLAESALREAQLVLPADGSLETSGRWS